MDEETFNELLDAAIETAISKAKGNCSEISRYEPLIRQELSDKVKLNTIGMHEVEKMDYAFGEAINLVPIYAKKFNPRFDTNKYHQRFNQKEIDLSDLDIMDKNGLPTGKKYAEGTTTRSLVAA